MLDRLDPDGTLTSVVEDFAQPNSLAFSPEESRLSLSTSELHHIRVFHVDHGKLTAANCSALMGRATTGSDLIILAVCGERLMTACTATTRMVP
jgi:sugar lactone lactonase YvrE